MYVVYDHVTGDILYAATDPIRFTNEVTRHWAGVPDVRVGTSNGTKFNLW